MKMLPMTEDEYGVWKPLSLKNYAADKVRANGMTPEEALVQATADFDRLLPEGFLTKDHFFYSMKSSDGENIGTLWFMIRGAEGNRKAFVCDIVVDETCRGRGYGKQAMLFLEEEARGLGLGRIGLHVFGFNTPARSLYTSLGYEVTDLIMEKTLS